MSDDFSSRPGDHGARNPPQKKRVRIERGPYAPASSSVREPDPQQDAQRRQEVSRRLGPAPHAESVRQPKPEPAIRQRRGVAAGPVTASNEAITPRPPLDGPPPFETLPGSGGPGGSGPSDGDFTEEGGRESFLSVMLRWIGKTLYKIMRWVVWAIWSLAWRGTAVVVIILGLTTLYNMSMLPPADELTDGRVRGSVTMSDRNGEVFAWRGDQFGGLVTVETVSPHLRNAVVATEDKRFYSHWGISPRGIASAVRINLSEGRGPLSGHGGSTITQQVAKLLCLGNAFDPDAGMTEAEYEADCRAGSV